MAEHETMTIESDGRKVEVDMEKLERMASGELDELIEDAKAGLAELRATGDSITFRGTFKSAAFRPMAGRGGVSVMTWAIRVKVNERVADYKPAHVARMIEEPAMVTYLLPQWSEDRFALRGYLDDVRVDGRRVWLMDLPPEELDIVITHRDHEMGRDGWIALVNWIRLVRPDSSVTVTVRALQATLL